MLVTLFISVLLGVTIVALVALPNRGKLLLLACVAIATLTVFSDSIWEPDAVEPIQITLDEEFFGDLGQSGDDAVSENIQQEIALIEAELSEIAIARTALVEEIGTLDRELAEFGLTNDPSENLMVTDPIAIDTHVVPWNWDMPCDGLMEGVDPPNLETNLSDACGPRLITQSGWGDRRANTYGEGIHFPTGPINQMGSGNIAAPNWTAGPDTLDLNFEYSAGDGGSDPISPEAQGQVMIAAQDRDIAVFALEELQHRETETRAGLNVALSMQPIDVSAPFTERRASLAHNIPALMTFGQSIPIRLVLIPDGDTQTAAAALGVDTGTVVEISDYMRATLIGSPFEIVQIGGSDRPMAGTRQAEWTWEVTPVAYGQDLRLLMTVEALVKEGETEDIIVHKTYERVVTVNVSRWNRIRLILADLQPMQITIAGILGIIVVASGLYFTFREKTKKPKPVEPLRFTGGGPSD